MLGLLSILYFADRSRTVGMALRPSRIETDKMTKTSHMAMRMRFQADPRALQPHESTS